MRDEVDMVDHLESSIARLIHQTDLIFSRSLQKSLDKLDISLEQWRIIYTLSVQDGITQLTLSELIVKDQTNVTRILDKLEKKGLVKRCPHPEDRRAFLLFLTEKGQQLRNVALPIVKQKVKQILHGITKDDQELLKILLAIMRKNAMESRLE